MSRSLKGRGNLSRPVSRAYAGQRATFSVTYYQVTKAVYSSRRMDRSSFFLKALLTSSEVPKILEVGGRDVGLDSFLKLF